jgi:hypothetical protein
MGTHYEDDGPFSSRYSAKKPEWRIYIRRRKKCAAQVPQINREPLQPTHTHTQLAIEANSHSTGGAFIF